MRHEKTFKYLLGSGLKLKMLNVDYYKFPRVANIYTDIVDEDVFGANELNRLPIIFFIYGHLGPSEIDFGKFFSKERLVVMYHISLYSGAILSCSIYKFPDNFNVKENRFFSDLENFELSSSDKFWRSLRVKLQVELGVISDIDLIELFYNQAATNTVVERIYFEYILRELDERFNLYISSDKNYEKAIESLGENRSGKFLPSRNRVHFLEQINRNAAFRANYNLCSKIDELIMSQINSYLTYYEKSDTIESWIGLSAFVSTRNRSNKDLIDYVNNPKYCNSLAKEELMLRHFNYKIDISAILHKANGRGIKIGFAVGDEDNKDYKKYSGFEIDLTYKLKLKEGFSALTGKWDEVTHILNEKAE